MALFEAFTSLCFLIGCSGSLLGVKFPMFKAENCLRLASCSCAFSKKLLISTQGALTVDCGRELGVGSEDKRRSARRERIDEHRFELVGALDVFWVQLVGGHRVGQ